MVLSSIPHHWNLYYKKMFLFDFSVKKSEKARITKSIKSNLNKSTLKQNAHVGITIIYKSTLKQNAHDGITIIYCTIQQIIAINLI